jgi:hypothetical protein
MNSHERRKARIAKRAEITAAIVSGIEAFKKGVANGSYPRKFVGDESLCIELALRRAGFEIVRKRGAN